MNRLTTLAAAGIVAAAVSAGAATAATQLTGAAIKDNTVTSADLRNGTIGIKDLNGVVRQLLTQAGPRGPQGPAGAPGPQGVPGAPGGLDASRLTTVMGPTVYVGPGGLDFTTVYCPIGQKVTGGGFTLISGGSGGTWASKPTPDGTGWSVYFENYDAAYTNAEGEAYAVCVAP